MLSVDFGAVCAVLDTLGIGHREFCRVAGVGASTWVRARSGEDVGQKVARKIFTAAEALRADQADRARRAALIDLCAAPPRAARPECPPVPVQRGDAASRATAA